MDTNAPTPLRPEELSADLIEGVNVCGPDDTDIGTIAHLHGQGSTAQVIIDVGGFLGLGAKHIALPLASVNFLRDYGGQIHATTEVTKDQLEELPEHSH